MEEKEQKEPVIYSQIFSKRVPGFNHSTDDTKYDALFFKIMHQAIHNFAARNCVGTEISS